MKKRLFSLFLALSLLCAILPQMASLNGNAAAANARGQNNAAVTTREEIPKTSSYSDITSDSDITDPDVVKMGRIGPNAYFKLISVGTVIFSETDEYWDEEVGAWVSQLEMVPINGYKLIVYGTGETADNYLWDEDYAYDRYRPVDGEIVSLVVEEGITSIGDDLFYENYYLKEVTLADTVTEIGWSAFCRCERLRDVKLSSNLKYIDDWAFAVCPSLQPMTIPASTETVFSSSFYFTGTDFRIRVEEGNNSFIVVDDVLFTKDMETLVFYPAGIPETSYAIPDGVKNIGIGREGPFKYYGSDVDNLQLETVTVPSSVEYVGCHSFTNVPVIRFLGDAPVFEKSIHVDENDNEKEMCDQFYGLVTVYYPRAAKGWAKTIAENFADRDPELVQFIAYGEDSNPFEDVKDDDWFKDAVLWAVSQKPAITNGTDATHFSPYKTCTRVEVVTFLWNAAGQPEASASASGSDLSEDNPFADVKESDWYYKAVMWAVANGVTSGTDATHFAPAKKCTRAEVVTFLRNASSDKNVASAANPFKDVKESDWYYNSVLWAVERGITSGTTPTTFAPTKTCTRAEVVQFLYKAS